MCNLFSGHISFAPEDWGKVYYFSGVHHEEDRERIPHENLIAWETIAEADFSDGFLFTHTCGKNVSQEEKDALMNLLQEWGKRQENQERLWMMRNDKAWSVRKRVAERIEDQNRLWMMKKDKDCYVRKAVAKRIEDQNRLWMMKDDEDWRVRKVVEERIGRKYVQYNKKIKR